MLFKDLFIICREFLFYLYAPFGSLKKRKKSKNEMNTISIGAFDVVFLFCFGVTCAHHIFHINIQFNGISVRYM